MAVTANQVVLMQDAGGITQCKAAAVNLYQNTIAFYDASTGLSRTMTMPAQTHSPVLSINSATTAAAAQAIRLPNCGLRAFSD